MTRLAGQHSSATAQNMCEQIANLVVRGLERAIKLEPAMPKYLREEVYTWLALMPGFRDDEKKLRKELDKPVTVEQESAWAAFPVTPLRPGRPLR